MSEAEFDIDAAAGEFDAGKDDLPLADVEELDADGNAIDPGGDDLPPGFKSFDEYVADGGDPDMYRGRKAYEAEHNRINENKDLKRELKGLKGTVQQTMDAVNEWQSTERKKIRTELEAELHEAMENEDPKAAVEAKEKLNELDDAPSPQPATGEESGVIQDFRAANPMIDADSEQWNEEFNADVEAFYNGMYAQLSYNGKKKLTDGQIKRCLKRAMREAEDLHDIEPPAGKADASARGESPRNSRQPGQRQQRGRRTRQQQAKPRAEDFKIDNPRNPRQGNAAAEVRDMIKKTAEDNARKQGKSAEDIAKAGTTASDNFETSLAR